MRYIICAFKGEALPFLDHFKLKRIYNLPYPLYQNGDILLVITHMGYENALMATSALMGYRPPSSHDILLNIGVCAAPKHFKIGELLVIHKINYKDYDYNLNILFQHSFSESALLSVDSIQSTMQNIPVDMEAHAVFKAAKKFMKSTQMLFIKIVSDHFDPKSTQKSKMTQSIQDHVSYIEEFIIQIETLNNSK
ncbi:MAG: hypothetical protein DRG24_02080 [Epsilonproteobacteria bacterium]|nr:MAG: hypothetical protein DRG24_02080 [Campylobacterota bacterium]